MKKILVVGSLNMDFSIHTPKMPQPGETIIGKDFTLNPGGKGANQAYALGKLGADVSMLGMVGNDEYGRKLINNLNEVSVKTDSIKLESNQTTGVAFVTVDDNGENNIIVIGGANQDVTTDFIDENIDLINESDIIVMQLEIPIETVLYVAKKAKENNKIVVLDPAPARSDLPAELFSYVDIVKPNETELEILSGRSVNSDEEVVVAARELLARGVKNVIVTLGGKGSLLVNNEVAKKFAALDVEVVDTTAAGDSFTAAVISSLANDKSLEESIGYGHLVSSIVVTRKGAQSSIPSVEEINAFLGGSHDE